MRSTILISAFAALTLAAPKPQAIEFDQVDAAPDPEIVTPPVEVTDSTPSAAQPVSVAAAIASDSITDTTSTQKRDLVEAVIGKRDGDCAVQPAGTGPAVTSPADDATSFMNYAPFHTAAQQAALAANVPQGYSLAFSDYSASSQTTSYLTTKLLTSYNVVQCASYCDQTAGCAAFNIYYERDPTQDPNAQSCPNPPSLTNIKCGLWGVQVQAATATNGGQPRDSFIVVISGSNGYNKNAAPATQPGFSGPVELGGAINAPNDPVTNTNTYMGYKFFSFQTVTTYAGGVAACAAACTSQTAYNARHPPTAPQTPNVCNQVVVYVLSQNNQPQGIYCAMYTEEWDRSYATNYGQYRGSDYWSVSQAYAYTNATYAAAYQPICAVGGCPSGSYRGGNCGGYGAGTC